MRVRRRHWLLLLILLAMTVLIDIGVRWIMQPLAIEVHNQRPEPVRNVVVSFTGGERRTAVLAPGAVWRLRVRPTGDSNVSLAFEDKTGRRTAWRADTYYTNGLRVQVRFMLTPGEVRWQDHTVLYFGTPDALPEQPAEEIIDENRPTAPARPGTDAPSSSGAP